MRELPWLLSFQGRIGRLRFAIVALAVFFSQHMVLLAAFHLLGRPAPWGAGFLTAPLYLLARLEPWPEATWLVGVIATTGVAWILAALAFRRAADSGTNPWWAALIVAPLLQLPVFLWLAVAPPRPSPNLAPEEPGSTTPGVDWTAAAQGLLAGIVLTTAAVAFGALILHRYGYAMFLGSPLLVGALTAYLANRRRDIGYGPTWRLSLMAVMLGALALIGFALEGAICIVMAAPLEACMAVLGAALGDAAARQLHHRRRHVLMSAPVLPLIFLSELLISPAAPMQTVDQIDIAAPPAAVWATLTQPDRLTERPALPFRLGVAYPVASRLEGVGVGAVRRGTFSTGEALERVTAWTPDRELAFVVLSDPPSMRELSPYPVVHAPHAVGYFRTVESRFTLRPLPNGDTRLILTSKHRLKLDPMVYWEPMARAVIAANTGRVLGHIKGRAEARLDSGR